MKNPKTTCLKISEKVGDSPPATNGLVKKLKKRAKLTWRGKASRGREQRKNREGTREHDMEGKRQQEHWVGSKGLQREATKRNEPEGRLPKSKSGKKN